MANPEPTRITAGNTAKWRKTVAGFSATDGWVLSYSFRGSSALDIEAVADGSNFVATIAAAESAELTAGDYWWTAYVSLAGERFPAGSGQITVDADLAGIATAYDGRSHIKKMLDALEALSVGKATRDQQSVKIGATDIVRLTPGDLLQWLNEYRKRWAAEQARADGRSQAKKYRVTFR